MLISMHSFLKILKTHKSHKSASKSHKSSSSHDFSNHRPRFPPGYIFTVDDWYHHDEHTHDKDDPVMGHNEKLARGGVACEDVVKKWHEWIFNCHLELILLWDFLRIPTKANQLVKTL